MALNLSTLRNIMRNDRGIATDVVRLEQIVWLIFLKIYDDMEQDLEIFDGFKSIIPDKYKWRNWVQQLTAQNCNFDLCKFPKEEEEVLPPDQLLAQYHRRRAQLDQKIDDVLQKIQEKLGIN